MPLTTTISKELKELEPVLNKEILNSLKRIGEYFQQLNTNVAISAFSEGRAVAPSGIGGYTHDHDFVEIFIDSDRSDIKHLIKKYFVYVLGHELIHALRFKKVGRGETLGDAVIDEGLACYFEYLIAGRKVPDYLQASLPHWESMYVKMRSSWHSKEFSYPLFFFGEFSEFLPRYASYVVGFQLVKAYIAANKLTLLAVMTADSRVFVSDKAN